MFQINDLSAALSGDLLNFRKKLGVISSIWRIADVYIVKLDDGTIIKYQLHDPVEIFRK